MSDSSSVELVLRVLREGLLLSLLVSFPLLLSSLVVGILSGLLSAVTQIQDHALSFVPRLIAMLVGVAVLGPYMGAQLVRFSTAVFALSGGVR